MLCVGRAYYPTSCLAFNGDVLSPNLVLKPSHEGLCREFMDVILYRWNVYNMNWRSNYAWLIQIPRRGPRLNEICIQLSTYILVLFTALKFKCISCMIGLAMTNDYFRWNHACASGDTRISTAPIFSRYITIFMHHTRLIFVYALDYTPRTWYVNSDDLLIEYFSGYLTLKFWIFCWETSVDRQTG